MGLLVVLMIIQAGIVLGRYIFGAGAVWAQELAVYFHGAIFMLGAAWALLSNRHVRIDVLSSLLAGLPTSESVKTTSKLDNTKGY